MTTALIFADIRTRVCHYYGERIVKLQILTNRDVNALLNDGLPLRFNPHLPSDPLRRQLLDDCLVLTPRYRRPLPFSA